MSLAVRGPSKNWSQCSTRLWRLSPHLFLCLSLVGYAALGAVLFQYIEGSSNYTISEEYYEFLGRIVDRVQDLTKNASVTQRDIAKTVSDEISKNFQTIWLQQPERWTFYGSMFFCCTVFTTVGYGEIYPVTLPGKVVCILYAMVGIPLMLLVISDVGDILAMLLSQAYLHLHSLCHRFRSPRLFPAKVENSAPRALEDGTFVFSHDVEVHKPIDIRQVLHSQADVKHKSLQLQNNKEIFEKILTRENFLTQGPLIRSCSCPALDSLPQPPKGYSMWDFSGIGDDMEQLNVPFVLILIVVFTYILFGGLILPVWETEFKDFDPFYFCFITLTTIGFGDIVPKHPKYFMLTSLFIIAGMAIMSMAFKLGQSRIVSCYHQCIQFMSRGKVKTFQNAEDNS
ncbi:potassium channel subfamily K member 18 [Lampris incognitus]|uniref:potassium channel subfamily K member 18 n=1 Tax=Lampris incognitus TaxID=2546036 RepID=UPI0024B4BC65|nr:potassium channel subfamily K member 18 [Lampris incognitus]